ncbi:fluoride efflux transporter CrcB [Bacillus dakarensis]|uniref:fluoride efflux transporter CrcB n=1 Tax=Robertmurraya dakarensis TaxID=1926278 RepID=UPI000981BF93|nr:fluoride efflux transporter CrcB [Bacillus dakarensis]
MSIFQILLVGAGGFFGAISRFFVSQYINKRVSASIPIGTLFINLLGSFLLGLLIGMGVGEYSFLLIGTGFMGAFTTFSTFKLEGIQLHLSNKKKEFFIYQLITYAGGILLAFIGILLGPYLT